MLRDIEKEAYWGWIMGMKWLVKIPGVLKLLDSWMRKYAEMRNAQEELGKVKKEKELLEQIVIKEAQEKYKYKGQLEKASTEWVHCVEYAVDKTWEAIRKEYYLVPKSPPSLAIAFAARNLLGQPLPPVEEPNK